MKNLKEDVRMDPIPILCPYKRRKFGQIERHQSYTAQRKQYEEAARGWRSVSQGERSLRKPTLLIP